MSALAEGRPPFLSLPLPHVTEATARLFGESGYRAAIVDLGDVRMHVHTAAQAREIAAAFTCAAMLLTAAEADECGAEPVATVTEADLPERAL